MRCKEDTALLSGFAVVVQGQESQALQGSTALVHPVPLILCGFLMVAGAHGAAPVDSHE